MLALLQGSAVDVADGPPDPKLQAELYKPRYKRERELCRRQRILSTVHSNFSIFFLALILTAGGLIILLSWVLEPLVAFIQRRRNLDSYARLEWCTNEKLQLQRLAHEELGMGIWDRCDEGVPVTEKGERLAVLDISDLEHPRLRARPRGVGEEDGGKEGPRCSVGVIEGGGRISRLSSMAAGSFDGDEILRAAVIAVAPDVSSSGGEREA
ncbi:hypothetical protein GTA08_BOTSDO13533 [Botryosphaeria dothidea]|uniref:Uncharacterized protein n=1 Tax=Botryosphaeria dothidea TaxID=55169 RepID=A0A8H4J2I1_9PEZI|nr:hypothetical protein GTA08_BOTSDO13533 [Botryosphaeria dothidea]